jgi:hypothetical protein
MFWNATKKGILLFILFFVVFSCSGPKKVFVAGEAYSREQALDSGLKYADKRVWLGSEETPQGSFFSAVEYNYLERALDLKHARRKLLSEKEMWGITYLSGYYYNIGRKTNDYSKFLSLYKTVGNKYRKNPKLPGYLEYYYHFLMLKPKEYVCINRDKLNKLLYKHTPYYKYLNERNLLEAVYDRDQKYRRILFGKAEDADSARTKLLLDSMDIADHQNFKVVDSILMKKGWLGLRQIGKKASDGIFYVIQHLDTPQFFKYRNVVEMSYKKGNLAKAAYAIYIDRFHTYKHGYQIYGTQSYYDKIAQKEKMYPLKDSLNVNNLRQQMGFKAIRF